MGYSQDWGVSSKGPAPILVTGLPARLTSYLASSEAAAEARCSSPSGDPARPVGPPLAICAPPLPGRLAT